VLYVVAMAAVTVGVDIVFFRNRFWERLTVNIGIVLVFAADRRVRDARCSNHRSYFLLSLWSPASAMPTKQLPD
jgi:hypothetical protein